MQRPHDRKLLEQFAYEEWLKRGKPVGSPEVDWASAQARIAREQRAAPAAGSATGAAGSADKPRPKKRLSVDRATRPPEKQ